MDGGKQWKIDIKAPFLGFAPAYYKNSYPVFGNRAHAGAMQNVDITDPTFITQGPTLANLTNGTQAGVVTTLIKHILEIPTASDVTWGVGGAKLYKISSTAVTSDANYPHTIDKAAVTGEDGESVAHYNGILYYFYNHSGSAGDIGKLTIATNTFDDDWGSTVPTGASALTNAPHPTVLGGDGIIYFGNGPSVGYYDALTNTLSAAELDLNVDVEVVDLLWEKDMLTIATNNPNIATGNANNGVIYTWNTTASSFQEPIIEVPGRIGSLIKKNGRIFVFYQDLSDSAFKLGYIAGDTVQELSSFSGSLPLFYQKTHYKNLISFVSSRSIYLWGASSNQVPIALSQFADGGNATVGALANPFGTPMVASYDGATSYRLAKLSTYDVSCNWKSLMFDVSTSMIDKIKVHFEPTASGSQCDFTITYNRGVPSAHTVGSVSHTNESGKIKKTFYPKLKVDDFRFEMNWANGSSTNPLKIRKVEITGHILADD